MENYTAEYVAAGMPNEENCRTIYSPVLGPVAQPETKIILGHEMQSRVMTNEFNKTIRRCRIGKVKPKPSKISAVKKHPLFSWIGHAKDELTPWFKPSA